MLRVLLKGSKVVKSINNGNRHLIAMSYHSQESDEDLRLSEWYQKGYQELVNLTEILKNVSLTNGRLLNMEDDSIIKDERISRDLQAFKSLARVLIASPSMQKAISGPCFGKPEERESMVLNSLTRVSDFLNVTAQQRKEVRLTICPQVTQHHIWRGALEEVLKNLRSEIGVLQCHSSTHTLQMGEQIVCSCLQFLANVTQSSDPDSPSWMKLGTQKKADDLPPRKWGDLLEMFYDLMKCLRREKRLVHHVMKLESMKEGLYQIKEVPADKDAGYKESRHQEHLVKKKLSQQLGHSSKCLFTLLLYYLYGSVTDIEVDLCGAIHGKGRTFHLWIGQILTSDNEKMVCSGIKHLNQALKLFKFVWESAGVKGTLALEGHLWAVNAEERLGQNSA
ncbi:hypothetical protein H6P81_020860 [Aristolochia fimbriata]|uniref:Uncharacterized protein n=1 Tax=Aristolochia fimbriata TaxID=158543 RepID=A0AAV7DXD7_ARIFI|nr:hypothetical protein H6P81_020860 [Aristolochia fimbriata]